MMTTLLGWMRSLIPVQTEIEWGAVASAAGALITHFTGWSDIHEALVVIMAIDYITGIAAAYINPNMKLNSKKGFAGFCKKMVILCLVALSHELDMALGQSTLTQPFVVWFFIANEGLSILENAGKAGLPIPKKLRETLEQLASEKEEKGERKS